MDPRTENSSLATWSTWPWRRHVPPLRLALLLWDKEHMSTHDFCVCVHPRPPLISPWGHSLPAAESAGALSSTKPNPSTRGRLATKYAQAESPSSWML